VTPHTSSPKQAFLIPCTQALLIHFQGHSQLSNSSPLNQHLDFSGKDLLEEEKEAKDMLTVNEIFDTRLQISALTTSMSCPSNQAKICNCDNLLGLVTAFHYAGASFAISALCPITSREGIAFSRVVYERLMADMAVDDAATAVNVAHARCKLRSWLWKKRGNKLTVWFGWFDFKWSLAVPEGFDWQDFY
jgi:CHAT domain-containing protein